MTINLSAAELTHVVTAVPGVRGIEPGIGSTLKAIGSRMSGDPAAARFGIIIESGAQKVIIEIGIDGSRTVKEIVRDVQEAVLRVGCGWWNSFPLLHMAHDEGTGACQPPPDCGFG